MNKKITVLALGAALLLSLTGCQAKTTLEDENIKITKYKELEVAQVIEEEITDQRVEDVVNARVSANSTTQEVTDRAAKDGDICNIDYVGSVNDVEFEGGTASGYDLTLGSGTFIGAAGECKGFEEQIVGHKTGEEFDIKVQFPDNYQSAELAGQVAKFHITLNSISERLDSELTDEWVQSVSETSTTVDEYRKEIRAELEGRSHDTWLSSMQNNIIDVLLNNIEVKSLPQDSIDTWIKNYKTQYERMADYYGLEWADFLSSYLGVDEEGFNTTIQEYAERSVKIELACKLIAKELKMEPSDEEYQEYVKKNADDAGYESTDAFVEYYGEDTIRTALIEEKVLTYLVDHCIQVEAAE